MSPFLCDFYVVKNDVTRHPDAILGFFGNTKEIIPQDSAHKHTLNILSQWIECLKLFLTFNDVRNICYIALRIA